MQANRQEVIGQIHQTVQSTINKMYERIDSIIEAAKSLVEEQPEKGDEVVQNITNYTRYMHNVIDKIVEQYTNFAQEENGDIPSFKQNVSALVEKAKMATAKIQTLIKS